RMIGYESITPVSPLSPAVIPPREETRDYLQNIRLLASAQGFHEVYNYSFLSDEIAQQFRLDTSGMIRVLNPIASDQALMRNTLVPGLWKNIIENSKYSDGFQLFELGREIHKRPEGLPLERTHLAAVVYRKEGNAEGLFELKALAEGLAPGIDFRPVQGAHHEHPWRTASAIIAGENVGRLFEFHPDFVRGRASLLDLDLESLMRLARRTTRYTPVRRFPSSAFDLSVLAPLRAHVGDIQSEMRSLAGDALESIEFVREYAGPPLPHHLKSLSYRLTFAASNRTLSSEEVGAARALIIDGMRERGYDLRV
ncbi:MAG TPA: phenylalanine--tRNA ligase subunit beta, partial [Bryobacteraceae bacterium]|nr:phenylalanine--tRNA ligase subunit beta [Bryobacteraceae bacterium]